MSKLNVTMRVYHRYLGFFLVGIMAMYAISGIIMIFRETEFLKSEKVVERTLPPDFRLEDLGRVVRMREFKIDKEENGVIFFKNGTFDKNTNTVKFTAKELPFVLDKMTHLHKATTKDPLFFLNIFFGLSLLFFVISSFYMFMPSSDIFKKGLYFAIGGAILTLILIFI